MSDERAFEVGRNLAVTPGQRRVPQRADRADPVRADDRRGAPAAARDRAAVHQQVLHPRPAARRIRSSAGRSAQGHTVFMISWRNIPPELGSPHLGRLPRAGRADGARASPAKIIRQHDGQRAGLLRRRHAARLRARRARGARATRSVESATFLTTMLDFADPGEIGVYVSREFLAAREPALHGGRARPRRRARRRVREPARQRSRLELRRQQLPQGRDAAGVRPAALERRFGEPAGTDVRLLPAQHLSRQQAERAGRADDGGRADRPVGASRCRPTSTRRATITSCRGAPPTAPPRCWAATSRFVLGASGHIAGVINPPAKQRRNYWTNELLTDDADDWLARADRHPGSWWPHWAAWLARHGGAMKPAPREAGNATSPAARAGAGTLRAPRPAIASSAAAAGTVARRRMTAKRRRIDPRQRPARPSVPQPG